MCQSCAMIQSAQSAAPSGGIMIISTFSARPQKSILSGFDMPQFHRLRLSEKHPPEVLTLLHRFNKTLARKRGNVNLRPQINNSEMPQNNNSETFGKQTGNRRSVILQSETENKNSREPKQRLLIRKCPKRWLGREGE